MARTTKFNESTILIQNRAERQKFLVEKLQNEIEEMNARSGPPNFDFSGCKTREQLLNDWEFDEYSDNISDDEEVVDDMDGSLLDAVDELDDENFEGSEASNKSFMI
jgi:hypothetical protein